MGKLPKGGKARARASAKLNRVKRQKTIIWQSSLVRSILKWDAPELSRLCSPVEKTDDLSFVKTLRNTLSATKNGLGLAAPQIGILKNAFVYRNKVADTPVICVMINPIIVKSGKNTATAHEGCLSFPGIVTKVERPTSVTINWKDEEWKDRSETFTGLVGIIVQHEIEHLFGTCHNRDVWLKSKEVVQLDSGFGHEQHDHKDEKTTEQEVIVSQ